MHSATILAEENTKLYTANHCQERKKQQQQQYIAIRGALQAQKGQLLIAKAKRVVQKSN